MIALRALLAALLLALPAAAQDAVPLEEAERAAWRAIGRVNVGGYKTRGTCTGALIAPDLVLTAAHCVPARATREVDPEAVHFLAGWFRDAAVAHRTAAAIHVHPDYVRGRRGGQWLYTDVALIELNAPIPDEVVEPLRLGAFPRFADDLQIIAYSNRRPGAQARTGPCPGISMSADLLGMTCEVLGGNSGAPVLRRGEGGWEIVAVAVAKSTGEGGVRAYAVRAPDALFELAGRPRP